MDVDVSTSVAGNKPQRIRRIQTVTLVLLFMAGIVNFLDRSSLSVAGEAIRGELGLSATEFGVLLSAFSLSYGFSQLPSGILLDRFGPRIVGNDSNLLIVFYVQIMPDDFVMQLHRF